MTSAEIADSLESNPVLVRHIQGLLEVEFQDAERAMEQRLARTTIARLVRQVLARERELGLKR